MYTAPVSDMTSTLTHIVGVDDAIEDGLFGDLTPDLVEAILSEAGRFAGEEIAPLNRVGDQVGAKRNDDGSITMPPGWAETYAAWREAGWNGLTADPGYGGQGLPLFMAVATGEMWNAASMAFGLGPLLTLGAIEAVSAHASSDLKARFLPKMVTGEWTGTMNLTEPQSGSDLSRLKTRAEPVGDGTYRIFGQKIYITYGEHELTENIVHLVLARIAGAPEGTRGISLFLVPKNLVDESGALVGRNDVYCAGIEEKLGIHGSPTCTMIYGDGRGEAPEPGAIGYLIGEENRGLACMFTMMNNARLMVAIQGVAQAERALQAATSFAQERRQGRSEKWQGEGMSPILLHPDIRRTLFAMNGLTAASRALCFACAFAIDRAEQASEDDRVYWQERANLLTPIAKAFSTDAGFDVASMGVQVHGGMGYVEETGAAQYMRDARIAQIYEGTNGIQAIDLVTRKLEQSGGDHVRGFIAELREEAEAVRTSNQTGFGSMGERILQALGDLEQATDHLLTCLAEKRTEEALTGATTFVRMFGLAGGAAYLAKGALAAASDNGENPQAARRIAVAQAFASQILPECAALKAAIIDGAGPVADTDPDLLVR